jgi:hypothetical protein
MKKVMLNLGLRVIYGQTARVTAFLIEVKVVIIFYNFIHLLHKNVSILYLYSYLKDNPHLSHFINKQDMRCVIPHRSNAVNIPHQTNARLTCIICYKPLSLHVVG